MTIKAKNVFLVAGSEYLKWLMNPKIMLLFTIFIPIRELILLPMFRAAEEMNQPINIFEPCIAVMNSGMITLLLSLLFIVLISSFPAVEGNMLFYISRMGRKSWLIGEILFQIMSVITFFVVIMAGILIQTQKISFAANGWSLVVTDYDSIYAEISGLHMSTLIPPNLYNQISPYKAFGFSAILLIVWLFFCSMLFLMGCICSKRLLFFWLLIVQIALGCALCSIKIPLMWLFPISHSILQLHYREYFRSYAFSPVWSLVLYLVILLILLIFLYKKAGKVNLSQIGGGTAQ